MQLIRYCPYQTPKMFERRASPSNFKYGGEFDCLMLSLLKYFSLEPLCPPWSTTILVWNK